MTASLVPSASRMPTVRAVTPRAASARIQDASSRRSRPSRIRSSPNSNSAVKVVAGRRDVPGDHLEECTGTRGGAWRSIRAATSAPTSGVQRRRQRPLLQREAVDVASCTEYADRQREREARLAEAPSTASWSASSRARAASAPPSGRSPTGGGAAPRGSRPPAGASPSASRRRSAAARSRSNTRSTRPSRRSSLLRDVVVERHRLDAELFAELAHAQRLDAGLVGQRERGAQHPLAAQRDAGRRGGAGSATVGRLQRRTA